MGTEAALEFLIELVDDMGMDVQNQGSNVSGYLIDMAEVWECYIRSVVQKQLREFGWKLIDSTFTVYETLFYQRKIIPDKLSQLFFRFLICMRVYIFVFSKKAVGLIPSLPASVLSFVDIFSASRHFYHPFLV